MTFGIGGIGQPAVAGFAEADEPLHGALDLPDDINIHRDRSGALPLDLCQKFGVFRGVRGFGGELVGDGQAGGDVRLVAEQGRR